MKHVLGDARVYSCAVLFGRPGCGVPGASLCIPHRPASVGVAVKTDCLARFEAVGCLQLVEPIARFLRRVLERDSRRAFLGGNRAVVDGPVGGAVGARKPPGYLLGKLGPGARRRIVGLLLAYGQVREGIPTRHHQVLHPAVVIAVARGGRVYQAGSGVVAGPRCGIGVRSIHECANLLVVMRVGAIGDAIGVGKRPHGILGDIHALVGRAVGMGHDVFELRQDAPQVHARDGRGVPRGSLREGGLGPLAGLGARARSRAARVSTPGSLTCLRIADLGAVAVYNMLVVRSEGLTCGGSQVRAVESRTLGKRHHLTCGVKQGRGCNQVGHDTGKLPGARLTRCCKVDFHLVVAEVVDGCLGVCIEQKCGPDSISSAHYAQNKGVALPCAFHGEVCPAVFA